MSTLTFYGRRIFLQPETLPGEEKNQDIVCQLLAPPHDSRVDAFLFRMGNHIYLFDPKMMEEARVKLPRDVRLGEIVDALQKEHKRQNFLLHESLDFHVRIRRVVAKLRRQFKRRK